jgi:hypothetical protein
VRLLELRDRLEERGWDDAKIENEVARERRQTLDRWTREVEASERLSLTDPEGGEAEKSAEGDGNVAVVAHAESTRRYNDRGPARFHQDQRHSDSNRKGKGGKNAQQQHALQEERNEKLRDAFGISEKNHKEGQSRFLTDDLADRLSERVAHVHISFRLLLLTSFSRGCIRPRTHRIKASREAAAQRTSSKSRKESSTAKDPRRKAVGKIRAPRKEGGQQTQQSQQKR